MSCWTLSVALSLGMLFHSPSSAVTLESDQQPLLSFPVLSDIHIQAWDLVSQRKFTAALQDLHKVRPAFDALILNGDLTNGRKADYDKLRELISSLPHPAHVHSTIGNHEYYKAWFDSSDAWNPAGFPNGETDQASIDRFLQFTGESKLYYDKVIKGYHFIFLGSEQYRQSDPTHLENAYLTSAQLGWLQQTLHKDRAKKQPLFIFHHQPLPNTISGTYTCCVNNLAVIQHKKLKAILSQYPEVILFTGHTHWELKLPQTRVQDPFTMINSSSVEQPWTDDGKGGEIELNSEASEGLVVDVYNNKVIIRGRDFTGHQWIPGAQFTIPAGTQR